MFFMLPGLMEYIKAGKLRSLAVTTSTRVEALPDVPSLGEFLPAAGQCKDDNDDEEHADDSAGTVSPAAAVAPGGKGADQHQNEYH
jgi:hypothetical protein